MRDDWSRSSVGAATRTLPGRYLPKEAYTIGGPYPVFGSNSLMGYAPLPLIDQPSVVMAAVGANAGAVRLSLSACWVNNNAFALVPSVPDLTVEYLYLWLDSRLDLGAVVAGTGQPYVKREALREQGLVYPRASEQRRIVDLVNKIDDVKAASERVAAAAEGALMAYLRDSFATMPSHVSGRRLGDLAAMGSGPSWKAADESPVADDATLPVVSITSTRAGSRDIDPSQRRYVRGLSGTVRLLTPDAVLMIRTNGNRSRIGNVYRVPDGATGHAYSAFQIGLFPHDAGDRSYVFWFLSSPGVQAAISVAASGSTGLGNVAVGWLKSLRVPWPDAAARAEICGLADVLYATAHAAKHVASEVLSARSAVVASLLTGEHVVPATYDRLLDGAT